MTNTEFLIVGNGLAGTLLAFELFDRGLDFRIMTSPEKSRASVVAAGMFNPLVFKRMTKSWMIDELIPAMNKKFTELEDKLQQKFLFQKEILKPLSEQELLLWKERSTDFEFSKYIRSVKIAEQFSGIKQSTGFGIVTQSGYLKLKEFLVAAEDFFRRKNKLINGTFSFQKFNPESDSWQFNEWNFNKIIFCEGHHITRNPVFKHIPFKPVKGEVLQLFIPELTEEFIINRRVFVLPTGNHRFKVGSTYEWEDLTERPTNEGRNSIIRRLEELISADYKIEQHWAGIRPAVIDRRPVLGFHHTYKNIAVFNGLGTKGVMLAPYFAHEMLNVLTARNYSVNDEVRVERFL